MTLSPKCRLIFAIMLLFFVSRLEGQLWPQEKEDLLFQEIPVVVTASRKEQPITEAPTTITVITSDDIRYSGATNIPDILRMVAGVDVMTITARDHQVGVRGFVTPLSNKLLVLVDGRSVYLDLYGSVLWDTIPVSLEEIERIEVVKSPASSIYGANAYSGVINIITKTPEQLKGTLFHVTAGSQNTLIGSVIHAGDAADKKIKYKVSAEWDNTNEWSENETEEKAGEIFRVNALLEYLVGEKSKLVLSAGRGHARDIELFAREVVGPGKLNERLDYLQFEFEYAHLKFRTFFKHESADAQWLQTGESQSWELFSYDAELFHSFKLGDTHALVWGINFRYYKLQKNSFFPEDYLQHLWSFFVEDEVKFKEKLRLTIGGRYDRHPLVGDHFSPRVNLFYSFSSNQRHIIRLSAAKAYRNPSFIDSYLYIEDQSNITLPPPLPPLEVPFSIISQGNQDLRAEGIVAYEIGYHATWGNHLKLDANLFYHRYSDFFTKLGVITFYNENEIFPGSPGGVIPKRFTEVVQNGGNAWGVGGEVNLDFSINDQISGFLNYAFQEITDKEDDPLTPQINEKNRIRPENPKHKLNAGLRVKVKNGFTLNFLAHWVDKAKKLINNREGNPYLAPVEDYFILNARVGYRFWRKKAELALSFFNLFNDKHYQFPPGMDLSIPYSNRIGRRVTFTVTVKF